MGRDKNGASPHDRAMELSSTLAWLVDAAADSAGANRFLAALGAHLIADGLPLAGGALTLDTPHPLVARRTWLWRADNGEVIEARDLGASFRLRALRAFFTQPPLRLGSRPKGHRQR